MPWDYLLMNSVFGIGPGEYNSFMRKLPIAETFHSLQGEGVYTNVPFFFIRTAGCNVGTAPEYGSCFTADGREFQCDTDYRKKLEFSLDEMLAEAWEEHICITGGEPFLHDLSEVLNFPSKHFHFETSGTLPLPKWLVTGRGRVRLWVSCSPKKGFLLSNQDIINEWKFLIDDSFKNAIRVIEETIGDSEAPVFLQPVNQTHAVNYHNLALCQKLLRERPDWRISMQTHKLVNLP